MGQNQVQGVDYAYTIQGWLKGVNSTSDPIAGTLGNGNDCGANSAVNDLTVNLRQTPYDDYKARSTITFEPGFESNASDNFETFIDTSLTACTNTTGIAGDDVYGGHAIYDMGKDGFTNSTGGFVSTGRNVQTSDAYGFSLNYFTSDYKPINANVKPFAEIAIGNDLFNGNIKAMGVIIPKLGDGIVYNYQYDQLNRIVTMDAYRGINSSNNAFNAVATTDYKERYKYDPNGNITRLSRNGSGTPLFMDSLAYNYKANTNQLDHVNDSVAITNYTTDIDDQAPNNYQYDAIGNLTADVKESITSITWSVYGKILSITKSGSTITYTYDASGNRISKTASGITTWYVRDASGNVMSVYVQGDNTKNAGVLTQSEAHLYGSSRLGIMNYNVNCANLIMPSLRIFTRGNKFFELSNHLGNVLATVSDKRIQHTTDNTLVDYYNADVVTANDYYSGGMLLPGRAFTQTTSSYRYGFNGKEKDNSTGEGNLDFGARILDVRLGGRWLSRDPLAEKYPNSSPYVFCLDNPIANIDPDGRLVIFVNGYRPTWPGKNVYREIVRKDNVFRYDKNKYWDGVNTKFMDKLGDHNAVYADGDAPTLTKGNQLGFDARVGHGRQAAQDLISKINSGEVLLHKNDKGEIDESIKIVSHSMGYAYSVGMIETLQKAGYKVEVSYNLAPENPTGGVSKNIKRIVQYGSDPNGPGKDHDWIAPQSQIANRTEGAIIPDKDKDGDEVPKGHIQSHLVKNYGKWIFDIKSTDPNGYVAPRKDLNKEVDYQQQQQYKAKEKFKNP